MKNVMLAKAKKRVELAEPSTVTANYAGDFALPFIAAAVLMATTLLNGVITVFENVPLEGRNMTTLTSSNIIQAAGCDFNHQGTITMTDKKLTPTDLKVNLQFCVANLFDHWVSENMSAGRMNKELPPEFQDFILMYVAAQVAEDVENNLWNGNSGHAGAPTTFTGLEKLITDAGAADATGTGSGIDASNVLTEIRKVTAAIPDTLKFEGVNIYVPKAIAQAYIEKLGNDGWHDNYSAGEKPLNVDGYNIVVAPGLDDNSMIAALPESLFFGTDLMSDHSEAKVIPQTDVDGSDNVNVVMKFTAGCQIGVRGDIVLYRYTVA